MKAIRKRGYLYDDDEMKGRDVATPEPLPPERDPEDATPADLERLAAVYAKRGNPLTAAVLRDWADKKRRP